MEQWKLGTRPEGVGLSTAERVQRIMGYGEMVKWVTCREPQGRAIGKMHIDKEVQDFYK